VKRRLICSRRVMKKCSNFTVAATRLNRYRAPMARDLARGDKLRASFVPAGLLFSVLPSPTDESVGYSLSPCRASDSHRLDWFSWTFFQGAPSKARGSRNVPHFGDPSRAPGSCSDGYVRCDDAGNSYALKAMRCYSRIRGQEIALCAYLPNSN
jgi:hypothetical protein